jgi:Protein of unknown function (DUF3568)
MLPLSGDADDQAKPAIAPGLDAGNGVLHDHSAHWRDPKPCSGCEEAIRGGLARELEAGEIHPVDSRLEEISEASGFEDLCTVFARGEDSRLEASLPQCMDEGQTTYAASFDRTWNAALGALRDANLQVKDTERDGNDGTIKAVRADDKDVTVALESAGPGTTSVKVRIGIFGDEEASKAIHRQIASRLGVTAG